MLALRCVSHANDLRLGAVIGEIAVCTGMEQGIDGPGDARVRVHGRMGNNQDC